MKTLIAWLRCRITRPTDDEQAQLGRWVITWIQLIGMLICVGLGLFYEAIGVPLRIEYVLAGCLALSVAMLLARVDTWIPFTLGVSTVLFGSQLVQWLAGGFAASGANCVWSL